MTVPEITQDMLNEAKLWVGYSKNVFDEEIEQTMQACAIDLGNAGVVKIDFTDPLIKQAVKLYLKAQFRSDDGDNKFANAYEHLKKALALSSDYNRYSEAMEAVWDAIAAASRPEVQDG